MNQGNLTAAQLAAGGTGSEYEDGVDIAGVGFGTTLTFQGLKLVATGFYNVGLGMQFKVT